MQLTTPSPSATIRPMPINGRWITTKEAAEIAGYKTNHISNLVRSGRLKAVRVGHSYLIDIDSLNEYLEDRPSSGRFKPGPKTQE